MADPDLAWQSGEIVSQLASDPATYVRTAAAVHPSPPPFDAVFAAVGIDGDGAKGARGRRAVVRTVRSECLDSILVWKPPPHGTCITNLLDHFTGVTED